MWINPETLQINNKVNIGRYIEINLSLTINKI